jgi:hypothetical protein
LLDKIDLPVQVQELDQILLTKIEKRVAKSDGALSKLKSAVIQAM